MRHRDTATVSLSGLSLPWFSPQHSLGQSPACPRPPLVLVVPISRSIITWAQTTQHAPALPLSTKPWPWALSICYSNQPNLRISPPKGDSRTSRPFQGTARSQLRIWPLIFTRHLRRSANHVPSQMDLCKHFYIYCQHILPLILVKRTFLIKIPVRFKLPSSSTRVACLHTAIWTPQKSTHLCHGVREINGP